MSAATSFNPTSTLTFGTTSFGQLEVGDLFIVIPYRYSSMYPSEAEVCTKTGEASAKSLASQHEFSMQPHDDITKLKCYPVE